MIGRNQAGWLAGEGYLTVAPDLFSWGSTLTCVRAAIRDMRRRQGRIFEDVEVIRDWLVPPGRGRPDPADGQGHDARAGLRPGAGVRRGRAQAHHRVLRHPPGLITS
jgi:hypothetical protein